MHAASIASHGRTGKICARGIASLGRISGQVVERIREIVIITTAAFKALRNNTFTIERRDRLDNGQGGRTIFYAIVGTVLGRICPTTSTERVIADSEEQQISHVLYVGAGEDIARGDRVTCGDLAVEVLGIREPAEADHHWEIDCLERQYEEVEEVGS